MIRLFEDERGPRIDVVDEPTLLHTLDALRQNQGTAFTYVNEAGAEEDQSYAALVAEAEAVAGGLLQLGLRPGDRVGLVLPRARDFVPLFWGAVRAGVVPVPMAPPLRADSANAWLAAAKGIVAKAGASLLVVDDELEGFAWSLVGGQLRRVCTRGALPHEGAAPPAPVVAPDDLCFLQFTSGSTSRPRGVRVTHASLVANTDAIMRDGLETRPNDRTLSWLPLYHDMGLIGFVISTVRYRTPTTLLSTLGFLKKPALWMHTADKHRATITFAPNFAYALAVRRTPEPQSLDLSCLRVVGCGAEPIRADTQRAFFEHFAPSGLDPRASLACYGMAEATLAMAFVALDAPLQTERLDPEPYRTEGRCVPATDGRAVEFVCCGLPMKGHELAVRGPDGKPLGERQIGELYFSGPSVADGYEGDEEATRQTFTPFGVKTGDLGYLSGAQVYVTGRSKDLLILNGRNYDPQDIEACVAEVDDVRKGNVIAFSTPGADSEKLVVVFETKAPSTDLERKVQAHLQTSLGLRATLLGLPPGSLPKTSSGKLQRRDARARYLAGTLGQRAGRWSHRAKLALALAHGIVRRLNARVASASSGRHHPSPEERDSPR